MKEQELQEVIKSKKVPNLLSILLIINAVFTFIGGVALMVFPEKVTYGMVLGHSADFLFHLLGSSAFSLAVLSFFGIYIKEQNGIRAAVLTFLVFHGLTAIIGLLSLFGGVSIFVSINAGVHTLFFLLFILFGFKKAFKKV